MASIEFIQKRITGKEKEIDKLEKKLARIRKAESTGWKVNPYYYDARDLHSALSDLEKAKKSFETYCAELTAAEEKANSRSVPAILDFLKIWKALCTEHYSAGLTAYFSEKQALRSLYSSYRELPYGSTEKQEAEDIFKVANDAFCCKISGYYEPYTYKRNGKTYTSKQKVRAGEYEYLKPYCNERTYEEAMQRLAKDLKIEAGRKYDFIIERTNAIVGEITNATDLKVGNKGDLNGYIVGTRGKAKVQTIGAGGCNIQCFHFRTLIHKG